MYGKKLKRLREDKGISLTRLSKLTGISKSYLSLLERDVHSNPSLEIIAKIANVFNIKVQDLVEKEKDTPKSSEDKKQLFKGTLKLEIELDTHIDSKKLKQLEEFIRALNSDSHNA